MSIYIAFVIGVTLGASVALLVLSLMVVGARSESPPMRDHYFAVLELIERESKDIEPAARRALNRVHSKVLGMAQAMPHQYQD